MSEQDFHEYDSQDAGAPPVDEIDGLLSVVARAFVGILFVALVVAVTYFAIPHL